MLLTLPAPLITSAFHLKGKLGNKVIACAFTLRYVQAASQEISYIEAK